MANGAWENQAPLREEAALAILRQSYVPPDGAGVQFSPYRSISLLQIQVAISSHKQRAKDRFWPMSAFRHRPHGSVESYPATLQASTRPSPYLRPSTFALPKASR